MMTRPGKAKQCVCGERVATLESVEALPHHTTKVQNYPPQ